MYEKKINNMNISPTQFIDYSLKINNTSFMGKYELHKFCPAKQNAESEEDVFVSEKQTLSEYAQKNIEILSKKYQEVYTDTNGQELNSENLNTLLKCTKSDYDSDIISSLLENYKINEIEELMELPQKDVLNQWYRMGCFDKDLKHSRAFNFKELNNILEKYPNVNADYLSFLSSIKILDFNNMSQDKYRKLSYEELFPLLKSAKLQNRFLEYSKLGSNFENLDISDIRENSYSGKVPRYIYHLTPKENYEQMVENGCIKLSSDPYFVRDGIFTFELENLFKRWNSKGAEYKETLIEGLLRQVTKNQDEIVILKIPTSKLEQNQLYIRSQKKFFGSSLTPRQEVMKIMATKYQDKENISTKDIFNVINESLNKCILEKNNDIHIRCGAPAYQSSLFKQRKEPIEYIYCDTIPLSNTEKLGEVKIAELNKFNENDKTMFVKNVFKTLLKSTSEANSVKLLSD